MTKIVILGQAGTRGRLREQMRTVAAWLDALREVFGQAGIDASIAAGMRGEPNRFFAREAGLEIGTPCAGVEFEQFADQRWQRIGFA